MDELSYALKMDPLALRLKNYAERDAAKDFPYSSKELRACYAQGAEKFGWARRPPEPRAMREGTELIGWGMATGTYTVMSLIAAAMGLPMEQVTFRLGESTLPFAPVKGGSSHVTTVGSAVKGVCEKLQKRFWKLAKAMPDSNFRMTRFSEVEFVGGYLQLVKMPLTAVPLTGQH